MKLSGLLAGLVVLPEELETDLEIAGLSLDSRQIQAGYVFIALHGEQHHGLHFAEQAIANGAVAILYESTAATPVLNACCQMIPVVDLGWRLGMIAARFYGMPSSQLRVIGITGTNGKTSCSQLLAQVLPDCGVIGTLGWGQLPQLQPTLNTTPDALALQQMLSYLLAHGTRAVAMEVSSHGLQQGRVQGVNFSGAVFTNSSRDHLDYHGSLEQYLQAKLSLFSMPGLEFAVVNLDDAKSSDVLAVLPAKVKPWTYSVSGRVLDPAASVWISQAEYRNDGTRFVVNFAGQAQAGFVPLLGCFNLQNAMAVLTSLLAMGQCFDQAVMRLTTLKPIAGRMECFGGQGKPVVVVDYAHSPDALEQVLAALRGEGRLWVVFGCGGNRDRGKRAEMGRIAETLADSVIVTDDNPRQEAPEAIVQDIIAGCRTDKVQVIHDRAAAIQVAIMQAGPQDCVVVAGKGHENYQEINGVKWPFSDQEQVARVLASWRQ